jgi:SAM-dependent methyltransferase
MSVWGHIFAAMYDRMTRSTEKAGLGAHREALIGTASGDVLEIGGGTGANLPFQDESFDVAVSTLVLCTVDDQPRALRELRRVLRPGGRLLFIEHVRAEDPKLARLQDRMQPVNVRVAHGCHCNRSTLLNIHAAGFDVAEIDHDTLKHAPPFIRPLVVGVAGSPC